MKLSVKSTGRVDIHAGWTEDIDLLVEAGARKLARQAPATDFAVARSWNDALDLPPPVPGVQLAHASHHELGDTRRRFITYIARATTAFREYLPTGITNDADRISRVGPGRRVNVLSSARPDAPRVLYAVPAFGWGSDPKDLA